MKHTNILDLRDAIVSGRISPSELVEESIARIEAVNPSVNAVIATRFDQARAEAKSNDYSHTVFKGIPILLKGLGMNMAGEPATAGAKLLAGNIAKTTSNFVQKILDLGFIVLGQTNTPEFGFKNITDPELYGHTSHPHHPAYSPGGSSGGAAAALLSGMVPVVAASDGGGSIRIPASWTGLVGLKPSRGSMPVGPGGYRGWQGASVSFFLNREVSEAEALFDAMYTEQLGAPFLSKRIAAPLVVNAQGESVLKPLRIAYTTRSPIRLDVSQAAEDLMEKTVKQLRALGHVVVEEEAPIDGLEIMKGYYFVNGVETAAMLKGISRQDVELITWVLYQYGLSLNGYEMVDALNQWDQAANDMHLFHERYDLYLTPSTAYTAPRLDENYFDEETRARMENIEHEADKYQVAWDMFEQSLKRTPFTMLANLTGQPAISLPMHITADGFPIGAQFMAPKGSEALLFEIAKQLEPHFEMLGEVEG